MLNIHEEQGQNSAEKPATATATASTTKKDEKKRKITYINTNYSGMKAHNERKKTRRYEIIVIIINRKSPNQKLSIIF